MPISQLIKLHLKNHFHFILVLTLCCLGVLFDLGNLNAIRQGTEGFYLQISKEMYQANSWLTPLYKGAAHWSKPPWHFWSADFLYTVFGSPSLMAARLSTGLTGLFGALIFARWLKRHFSINTTLSFVAILCTVGMYKYSRIYMMEMPLAVFTTIGALKFYDYLEAQHLRDLFYAILSLAIATLVKGPVSLVMVGLGCLLYALHQQFFHRGERVAHLWTKLITFGFLSTALASIWYILCYQQYGMEFINYFFLRENMGKFTAQSYPISVLLKGLIIYSLPLTLLLPFVFLYLKKNAASILSPFASHTERAFIFLTLNFIPFFFLWFIPSQRSHHYALPALPLFLMILLSASYQLWHGTQVACGASERWKKIMVMIAHSGMAIIGISSIVAIILLSLNAFATPALTIALVILVIILVSYFCSKSVLAKLCAYFSLFALIWSLLIPQLSLPDISNEALGQIEEQSVSTTLRKFYFISEAIGREVEPIAANQIAEKIDAGHLVIIESELMTEELASKAQILSSWPVWRRRMHLSTIISRYRQAGLAGLQETRLLIGARK